MTSEASNDGTESFGYDAAGQVTSATGWRSESYSYDGTGNRTMSGYSTGTGNRLLSDGSFNYTYDADGNMVIKTEIATGKVTTYTWDYRNRLTSVTVKDSGNNVVQQSNYTYDPFDRRIGTSFDPDGAGPQPAVQTWTVYDGTNPYADFSGSGTLTQRYLYGPAVDEVLARFDPSGNIGWYLGDQLGSVRDIADPSGTVVDHIKYDSFGKVLSESSSSSGDRFKYTARELDGTGDYYYRARYYNPRTGRFTSEDPTGLAAGDTNVFRYGANSPTNSTDPTGLCGGLGGSGGGNSAAGKSTTGDMSASDRYAQPAKDPRDGMGFWERVWYGFSETDEQRSQREQAEQDRRLLETGKYHDAYDEDRFYQLHLSKDQYRRYQERMERWNSRRPSGIGGTITGIEKKYETPREATVDHWVKLADQGDYWNLIIGPGGMGEHGLIVGGAFAGGAGGNPFPGVWKPPEPEPPPPPPPPPVRTPGGNWGMDMPPWWPQQPYPWRGQWPPPVNPN